MDIFWLVVSFWQMLVGGGGHILAGGGSWWVMVGGGGHILAGGR